LTLRTSATKSLSARMRFKPTAKELSSAKWKTNRSPSAAATTSKEDAVVVVEPMVLVVVPMVPVLNLRLERPMRTKQADLNLPPTRMRSPKPPLKADKETNPEANPEPPRLTLMLPPMVMRKPPDVVARESQEVIRPTSLTRTAKANKKSSRPPLAHIKFPPSRLFPVKTPSSAKTTPRQKETKPKRRDSVDLDPHVMTKIVPTVHPEVAEATEATEAPIIKEVIEAVRPVVVTITKVRMPRSQDPHVSSATVVTMRATEATEATEATREVVITTAPVAEVATRTTTVVTAVVRASAADSVATATTRTDNSPVNPVNPALPAVEMTNPEVLVPKPPVRLVAPPSRVASLSTVNSRVKTEPRTIA